MSSVCTHVVPKSKTCYAHSGKAYVYYLITGGSIEYTTACLWLDEVTLLITTCSLHKYKYNLLFFFKMLFFRWRKFCLHKIYNNKHQFQFSSARTTAHVIEQHSAVITMLFEIQSRSRRFGGRVHQAIFEFQVHQQREATQAGGEGGTCLKSCVFLDLTIK